MTEPKGQPNPLSLLNRYRLELFHAHCALIDQLFLRRWAVDLSARKEPRKASKWDCILIDDRATNQTKICILNTLLMTRLQASVSIYTPASKVQAFRELLEPFASWITIRDLDAYGISDALGWGKYNQLLKTAAFWKSITAEHVLIFQPDSLLIQPLELNTLGYGYAGAPWSKGRITSCEFPTYNLELERTGATWVNQGLCQTVPDHTNNGNGGLSIRDPKLMQAICEDHAQDSPADEAEDIFFARYLDSKHYNSNLPSQEALARLFNESSYTDSCGFHGSWYYLDASEQARLYDKHVKHVIGLLLAL